MYRQAERREGRDIEGPPGVFLRVSYIRLENSSAHRDVCPHNRPLRLLYSRRKSYFFSEKGAPFPNRATITFSHPTLQTSRPFHGQKHCQKERFLADWCGYVLSSRASLLCRTGRAGLKFGASHLAAGLILAPIRTPVASGKGRCEAAGKRMRDLQGWTISIA